MMDKSSLLCVRLREVLQTEIVDIGLFHKNASLYKVFASLVSLLINEVAINYAVFWIFTIPLRFRIRSIIRFVSLAFCSPSGNGANRSNTPVFFSKLPVAPAQISGCRHQAKVFDIIKDHRDKRNWFFVNGFSVISISPEHRIPYFVEISFNSFFDFLSTIKLNQLIQKLSSFIPVAKIMTADKDGLHCYIQ